MKYSADEYLYIRGFLICDTYCDELKEKKKWKHFPFGKNKKLNLYYDPRNNVAYQSNNTGFVLTIGTFCDTESGDMDITRITANLFTQLKNGLDCFYDYIEILGGRHAIVFSINDDIKILTDASSMRSVFYHQHKTIIGSHFNLVNDYAKEPEEPLFETIYEHRKKMPYCVYLPGDMTPYQNIKQLLPNQSFSLTTKILERFFPREKDIALFKGAGSQRLNEKFDYIAKTLKTQYEALANKYDIIHSLTAGCDSRICLSAAKNVKDKITCFTYHNHYYNPLDKECIDRERNYRLAKTLCDKEEIKYFDFYVDGEKNPDLLKIMNRNAYHIHNRLIDQISEKYDFKPNTLHVRSSLVEICRDLEHALLSYSRKSLSDCFMTWAHFDDIKETVSDTYDEYLSRTQTNRFAESVHKKYWNAIFYWEQRLPCWMNSGVLIDNDILCDSYMIFNVRSIMKIGFLMPMYWKDQNILFNEIIGRLWPDLLYYNLPNEDMKPYQQIDKEYSEALRMDKALLLSGSTISNERTVDVYYDHQKYSARFGFVSGSLKSGDFCELVFEKKVEKGLSYFGEFNILTLYNEESTSDIVYSILLDDRTIHSESCSSYNNRTNQIIVGFKASESKQMKIKIRVKAIKDINGYYYNGVVCVKSVLIRQEYIKQFSEKPMVFCTREHYFKM